MNTPLNSILEQMEPISLEEMKSVRLMDRMDFKYVAPISILPQLLEKAIPYFKVQEINGNRIAPYCTQYLDTPDLDMFVMHQNGKLNRQKIRIRSYVDSKLSFLEIKNKNNKGRTKKKRIPVNLSHVETIEDLNSDKQFLAENSVFDIQNLKPALANEFDRITLVNKKGTERITIDLNLLFINCKTDERKALENLMVLELKQDGWKHSEFRDILNELRIKRLSFSKYCVGTALTNSQVKYNKLKRKLMNLTKLTR